MEIIKDWCYAIGVCWKCGIRWSPFCNRGVGYYRYGSIKPTISVNPFDPKFKEIFFHELGHHVAKKVGYLKKAKEYLASVPKEERILLDGHPYRILLSEEAFASRFARKALKNKLDTHYLVKCFQTYTACGYKYSGIDSTDLTNQVSKLIGKIEK